MEVKRALSTARRCGRNEGDILRCRYYLCSSELQAHDFSRG
nr:MAG TPA: hypothetical protein [Caudoviricetes sp.]